MHVIEAVLEKHRPSVIVALNPAAADLSEKRNLLCRFHSLSQRQHAQPFCHHHDGSDDLTAPVIEVAEKTHVDLDLIKMVVVKRRQRGVLASEVVHPDLIPGLLKTADRRDHAEAVAYHNPLRDLEPQRTARHLIPSHHCLNGMKRVRHLKIIAGEINRNRDQRKSVVHAVSEKLQNPFQNEPVQPVDQLGFLENRDKDCRRNHADLRILPAGQRLESA